MYPELNESDANKPEARDEALFPAAEPEPKLPPAQATTRFKSPRWRLLPSDEALVSRLAESLQVPPLFARLMAMQGIHERADARLFFKPDLNDLHDPFLMADMARAVERLDKALQRNERILLYGDYDVDGATSVALMYEFLSGFYRNLDYYIPDREKEGYGVSIASVEYARQTACHLVIAMDCGIKAHAAIETAKNYGIDFIVCDHHMPEGGLPAAVANLDPKREDCNYPYKHLSGCGIAFKLAQAITQHNGQALQMLEPMLDLVAVSIACDIVPMTGENRTLAMLGLRRLNTAPRIGLLALIRRINKVPPLQVSDLVFGVGPVINAAGRMTDAKEAVRLLLSADPHHASDRAGALISCNNDRREVDYAMAEQARSRFLNLPDWQERKTIVLFDPHWHKGVIGIAASRMAEAFHKPSVVLTQSNGRAVGSARSVAGFDLYQALQQCEDLFYSYGGHAHAAGMQMPVENIDRFIERFEALGAKHITPALEEPLIELSAELRLEDINAAFWRMLKRFEPFGPQHRSPVFFARRVVDSGRSKLLGNNHVRLSLRHADGKTAMNGIGYSLGNVFEALHDQVFDIAFSIKEDLWRGERVLTLQVKDIQADMNTRLST